MEYRFYAKNISGESVSGNKQAASEREVVLWLRELLLVPVEVRQTRRSVFKAFKKRLCGHIHPPYFARTLIPASEKVNFFRSLSFLISAGISLSSSLNILLEQAVSPRLKKIIASVLEEIRSGAAFSQAMGVFPRVFDPLCLAFARTGEESGLLADSMAELSSFVESRERLRGKIVSALAYPALVLLIALAALVVMTAVVIPQFEKAFSALDVPLPPITKLAFSTGRHARKLWPLFPMALVTLPSLVVFTRRRSAAKSWLDGLVLKLPVVGRLVGLAVLSRSFRAMASLLSRGVPLSRSLNISGEVASNAQARSAFERVRRGSLSGISVSAAMSECRFFPPLASRLIRIGEETGKTCSMFKKLAENYEFELDELIKKLTALLEPMLVVFVGAVVSLLAFAVFMPVVSAIEAFI